MAYTPEQLREDVEKALKDFESTRGFLDQAIHDLERDDLVDAVDSARIMVLRAKRAYARLSQALVERNLAMLSIITSIED